MPCLSLRHHVIFRRLCAWVDAGRASTNALRSASTEDVSENSPKEFTVTYAEDSTIVSVESLSEIIPAEDSSSSARLADDTLYIPHHRPASLAPKLAQLANPSPALAETFDLSLAELVNAKLQLLTTPETVANPADEKSSVTPENSKIAENQMTSETTTSPKPALPFINFFRRSIRPTHPPRRLNASELLNAESRLGSTIFGPIPAGHRREFFHDKQNIWIWHESWHDQTLAERQITVRYEVRPNGIYKKFAAGRYVRLEGAELTNFRKAAHAYLQVIKAGLYQPADTTTAS